MDTHPIWLDRGTAGRYPGLAEDLDVDVLVIGGGITGVTAAYLLAKEGISTALIERGEIGGGDTGHTTAHLTYMTDTRLLRLISTFGEERTSSAWRAGANAMGFIIETVETLGIRCELARVPGYLVAASGDGHEEREVLRQEAALANAFAFPGVRFIREAPPSGRPGILFPNQLKFHPLLYLRALAEAAVAGGARIYENTSAESFSEGPLAVKANGRTIRYRNVVIATHIPIQGNSGMVPAAFFQSKLASYSTYAVSSLLPHGRLPEMIWSDTSDPFFYLRVDPGPEGDRVILGGGDYKTGQLRDTTGVYRKLARELRRIAGEARVTARWSGQVVETVDGLPYIGPNGKGQFIATGFSGNGMTYGTLGGMMARDFITRRTNPWQKLFAPSRLIPSSLGTYVRENRDFPVRMISDRLRTRREDPYVPAPGEGKVLMEDGERIAVYHDQRSELHRMSAICPHLGGVVGWNSAEKTWDCPCHGSRFSCKGDLIAGPAEQGLKVMEHH